MTRTDHRRRLRRVALLLLIGSLLGGLAAVTLRVVRPLQDLLPATLAASFVPYGIVAWILATVVAATLAVTTPAGPDRRRGHRRALIGSVVVALAGLVVQLAWLAPLAVPDRPAADGVRLTVVTINLRGGGADPAGLAGQLADVDVAMLVEVSPQALTALDATPAGARLRHRVGEPGRGVVGTMILSTTPLRDGRRIDGRLGQWRATADIDGLGAVDLVAVHPCNPPCGIDVWHTESEAIRAAAGGTEGAGDAGGAGGAGIVAGDFNATDDHVTMRRLYDDGWASAVDLSGAGWIPTYPANGYVRPAGIRVPPLITIDHILLGRRLTAVSVTPVEIGLTDHRGLRAIIAPAA